MSPSTMSPRRTRLVTDSPIGPLTLLAVDGSLAGLYMDGREPDGPDGLDGPDALDGPDTLDGPDGPAGPDSPIRADSAAERNSLVLAVAAGQLDEYFAGQRQNFDLPLTLEGTAFQRRVWDALQDIPYGETTSYGHLAGQIGRPTAARAVGLANGRNPVSIIVPCHRVVGSDGSLTGYGGGIDRKRRLLDLEQRVSRSACSPGAATTRPELSGHRPPG